MDDVPFYISGVTCACMAVVGLLINGYAIFTLIRQKMTAIFHKLMLTLVMFDFFYVLFLLFGYSLPELSKEYEGKKEICVLKICFKGTKKCCS